MMRSYWKLPLGIVTWINSDPLEGLAHHACTVLFLLSSIIKMKYPEIVKIIAVYDILCPIKSG